MQDYHLFEYAVVRLVPRVERGEFLNIGTILYCPGQRYLESVFHWDQQRIMTLFPETDLDLVKHYACSFGLICAGREEGGAIAGMALAERFRWLTATRSTIIQASPVHTGYTRDARETLMRLHKELVV